MNRKRNTIINDLFLSKVTILLVLTNYNLFNSKRHKILYSSDKTHPNIKTLVNISDFLMEIPIEEIHRIQFIHVNCL